MDTPISWLTNPVFLELTVCLPPFLLGEPFIIVTFLGFIVPASAFPLVVPGFLVNGGLPNRFLADTLPCLFEFSPTLVGRDASPRRSTAGVLVVAASGLSTSIASLSTLCSFIIRLAMFSAVSSTSPCSSARRTLSRLAALSVGSAHEVYWIMTSRSSSLASSSTFLGISSSRPAPLTSSRFVPIEPDPCFPSASSIVRVLSLSPLLLSEWALSVLLLPSTLPVPLSVGVRCLPVSIHLSSLLLLLR